MFSTMDCFIFVSSVNLTTIDRSDSDDFRRRLTPLSRCSILDRCDFWLLTSFCIAWCKLEPHPFRVFKMQLFQPIYGYSMNMSVRVHVNCKQCLYDAFNFYANGSFVALNCFMNGTWQFFRQPPLSFKIASRCWNQALFLFQHVPPSPSMLYAEHDWSARSPFSTQSCFIGGTQMQWTFVSLFGKLNGKVGSICMWSIIADREISVRFRSITND